MIDDPEQAKNLMEKMKIHLPIQVRGTKELMRSLKLSKQRIQIGSVLYMGDEGGIVCALRIQGKKALRQLFRLPISVLQMHIRLQKI